jgi:hypothetical protein
MTTRPGPAPERGGSPVALDGLRRKGGLKKARASSVIADMTRAEEAAPQASIQFAPERAESQYDNPPSPASVQEIQPAQEATAFQAAPGQQAPAAPEVAPTAAPAPVYSEPQPVELQPERQFVPQQVQLRQPPPVPPVVEKKYRKTSFFQSKESGARMRSAYMATRHLTGARTLSDFILAAVEREVEALERQYNGGDKFTADPNSVPRGRPLET